MPSKEGKEGSIMFRTMRLVLKHIRIVCIHKAWVTFYIFSIIARLFKRAFLHDMSKLYIDEIRGFSQFVDNYGSCNYDSPQYNERKKLLADTLALHYQRNSHHPEHYGDIRMMNIIDVVEMVCDWKAAVHYNHGSVKASLQAQKARYKLEGQMLKYIITLSCIEQEESEREKIEAIKEDKNG
jgi:hypothetical protein